MSSPRLSVSVVIPTYNRGLLLSRAIDSVLAQFESDDDELIVVDDGSTDGTPAVLETYGGRIRTVQGAHGGAGAARNLGVAVATADLVAFLDSDDEWMPGKLAAQRDLMASREDVLFAFGNMACTMMDGTIERRYLWNWHQDDRAWSEILPHQEAFSKIARLPRGWDDFQVYVGGLYSDLAHRLYVLTSSCIVRRREAGTALYFEEDIPMYEDWACFARLARVGSAAYMDTELTWQHGHRGERLTDADRMTQLACRLTILRRLWGVDDEYQASHQAGFRKLIDEQLKSKAAALIVGGDRHAAQEALSEMTVPPLSLRVLVRLPAPLVRLLFRLRRAMIVVAPGERALHP